MKLKTYAGDVLVMNAIKDNTVPAERQVLDKVNYLGEKGVKVLILGNSITLHGPKPEIGWFSHWGMAASSRENDYVHLLYEKARTAGFETVFCFVGVVDWERGFWKREILDGFGNIREFKPDIIIFRLGENILPEDCDRHSLPQAITGLIDYLAVAGHTKLIFTTCFWRHEKADKSIEEAAASENADLVRLGDLGEDAGMKALGLFEHSGVAAHPGDKGMAHIAERIWESLGKMLEEKTSIQKTEKETG